LTQAPAFGFVTFVLIKLPVGKARELNPFLIGSAVFSLISLLV
jgi:adenine/guanine/hypoxanthine permease